MRFEGDIIITDPCYIIKDKDWTRCYRKKEMDSIGLTNYIARDTIFGDWRCTVFDSDTKKPIGNFCADTGMVGVFLMDEVIAHNPEFDYHISKPWMAALIKDFKGDVDFEVGDNGVRVIGKGNINFVGVQTGF